MIQNPIIIWENKNKYDCNIVLIIEYKEDE